jgi:hypothetical protein
MRAYAAAALVACGLGAETGRRDCYVIAVRSTNGQPLMQVLKIIGKS